jgi:hypothetical protein
MALQMRIDALPFCKFWFLDFGFGLKSQEPEI